MTRIVIVGEIYNADLSIGGGPMPGGPYPDQGLPGRPPGRPSHPIYYPPYPDQGLPGGQPYPDQGLPGSQPHPSHPIAPGTPPGFWGGVAPPYPDQGLPGGGQNGGTPVPEDVYTPAPIPEELASQRVVSTYDPRTTIWTTKSYPPR